MHIVPYTQITVGLQSHHGQTAPLLPDDSTTAQESCNHHEAASQDEDICWDSKCAGGQQTQVVALLHYCPDSHAQNGSSTQLKETGREKKGGGSLRRVLT